jgi:hypothetical protein
MLNLLCFTLKKSNQLYLKHSSYNELFIIELLSLNLNYNLKNAFEKIWIDI